MKTYIIAFFFLFAVFQVNSQNCQGVFLIDSLDNLSVWDTAGVQVVPGFGNPPGALAINTVQKRLQFWAFKNKQTYRLQRPLGCKLDSNDTWTAEFEFVINSTAMNELAGLFILTEDTGHWQSNTPAGYNFNKNDAIAFFIEDSLHLSGQLQAMQAFVIGKKDSIISSNQTVAIDLTRHIYYYTRIQRTNSSTIKLSIFDDSLRTNHVNHSPVYIQIDSSIGNLNYLQFATKTASPQLRSSYVFSYNYRIYSGLTTGFSNLDLEINKNYTVGPNPTANELSVRQQEIKTISVRLINDLGREVYSKDNWTGQDLRINTEKFVPGLYFLEILSEQDRNVKKIIIQ